MGKIRTKILGSGEEQVQKEKDKVRREQKKEQKVTKLKGKGGGRIKDLSQEEIITPETVLPKIEEEAKKAKKAPRLRGAKFKKAASLVTKDKLYSIPEAVKLVKQTSYSKFVGSVETHINVKEKGLRGSVTFPHGTGKLVRIVIADDKILENIGSGKIDFDILISHPQYMGKLAKYARILGPKGLMPNPKAGTISTEPEKVAKKMACGQTQWKTETEAPIIHMIIGKVNFEEKKLAENLQKLIASVNPDKITSVFIKATMGPSIKVKFLV